MKIEVETDNCGNWTGVIIDGCRTSFNNALELVLKKRCITPKTKPDYEIYFSGHKISFLNIRRVGRYYGDWIFDIIIDNYMFGKDHEKATKYLFEETLQSNKPDGFNTPGGVFTNCDNDYFIPRFMFGKEIKFGKCINNLTNFGDVIKEFEDRLKMFNELQNGGKKVLTFYV